MNREFMIMEASKRLSELEGEYNLALENKTKDGKVVTDGGARVLRSKIKRDICILTLILELLQSTDVVYIRDDDSILGFDKLIKG